MSKEHTLIDIQDIDFNFNQPKVSRSKQFLEFIQNPYRYKHGKHMIIIEFSDSGNFDDCFAHGLTSSNENFLRSN